MDNNNVLQRIRYIFDFSDDKMIRIFGQADLEVTRAEVSNWLKKEEDPDYAMLNDKLLATFLNGLINDKRGKKEGEQPKPEKRLTNNLILRKLKIALELKSEDLLEMLELAGFKLSKHELSAFFRKPEQRQYRVCKDQVLRNLLKGMQLKYRPEPNESKTEEAS
ncbi:YehS family protein [Microscilla marina]|uniref:YehS n=1 Tax=Microscilla marina ATCC 23134 TaxID=313606 RepID=A1ZZP9_MICM2|nr:DUF1456 family protein [Microscilla marina]EAY24157.1 YehS [Microscilla marina ATCC 23134]